MDSTTQLTIRRTGTTTPARTSGSPAPPGSHEITHSGAHVYDPDRPAGSLHLRAARVLEGNWTGTSTVPSHGLYPHQWSWDSAFIAIGLRHLSPLRAQTELETLLGAQWGDGRIPHIVFNPSVPLDAYFPSPDFWRSSTAGRAAGAPRTVQTSGIVQPPVHALAAWLVHQADPGLSRSRSFLSRMYPRLAAWHRYLLHRRDLGGGGLASVVHPWEQGMDNSPCWDAPLSRVTPAAPRSFRRADLDHGSAEDRPTDLDYGRYVRLATDYRDGGYADGAGEFAVEDPAFNALLIASEHALAAIAQELGAAGTARHARAERLTAALVERLWDPAEGMFFCRDVYGGDGGDGESYGGDARDGDARDGGRSGALSSERRSLESGALASERRSSESGAHGSERGSRSGTLAPEQHSAESGAHASERRSRQSGAHASEQRSRAGALIPERSVAGLLPLILPALPRDIAATLVRTAGGPHFGLGGVARLAPSYDLTGHAFDPHRYWRGPAWFNTNWLLERGLRLHGEHGRAEELRAALLETADTSGFAEYVDPYTGEACGALGFSWTAALTLDLLHEPARADQADRSDQSTHVVSHPGHRAFDKAQGTPPHTSHASHTPHTPHTPHSSFETGAKGGDRG
ncbi:MGH1-like glycoside hydrolase domain-containing protein [Streptomyces mirabilis]|uniref:MGH1-like glycoside hydrolase domain-containing protein n=1 Tax=Streptomyces mirabilis TaxID=68239 RepID=UPI00332A2535